MATDMESQLLQACETGDLNGFISLSNGVDFIARDHDIGKSCLWKAAAEGCQGIVRDILERNPSLATRKDENGFSAMHLAAREGKIEVIQELLRRDILLSLLRDNDGRTPLQLAAVSHKGAVVREFLPGSALYKKLQFIITGLINMADNNGNTILHHAAVHHAATGNFLEVLGTLVIMEGMDVNAVNKEGKTALQILIQPPAISTPERKQIIQQLKDKEEGTLSVTPVHQTLMVVAALICTITFQAGLNPPRGYWPESNGTNQTDHKAGTAIQNTTNPLVLMAFMVFDVMAFTTAVALIPTIIVQPKKALWFVNSLATAALFCVQVTFLLGIVLFFEGKSYGRIGVATIILALIFLPYGIGILWLCTTDH